RYDATENQLSTDTSLQRRILKRRYYLVVKAKDTAIVGLLVGTLGVGLDLLLAILVENKPIILLPNSDKVTSLLAVGSLPELSGS
ncbi:2-(3-amino-3-carboxypropyl)histidine synthase subunit 2, partial [Tanacetum coccineum]